LPRRKSRLWMVDGRWSMVRNSLSKETYRDRTSLNNGITRPEWGIRGGGRVRIQAVRTGNIFFATRIDKSIEILPCLINLDKWLESWIFLICALFFQMSTIKLVNRDFF
jgi:hypothetical protein